MKIFLTEVYDNEEDKVFIGPYIKAKNLEEAQKVAYDYKLLLVGEIHELILDANDERFTETIH